MHLSQNKRNPGVPKPRLFTVGRLDVNTTGLIIVTNDGIDPLHATIHNIWPDESIFSNNELFV